MPEMNAKKPVEMREREPFHRNADFYHKGGWLPFPIPARSKGTPPTGVTGQVSISHKAWRKKLDAWLKPGKRPKSDSIAMRMPEGVLCIDVDAYKESGLDTLAEIAEEVGVELPPTWRQSARWDGTSAHYLYQVPKGLKWPGAIGPGIETVHSTHRYLVSAPSIHEKQGKDPEVGTYYWYAPDEHIDGEGHIAPPPVSKLPELPAEWVEYLTSGRHAKLLPEKTFRSRSESDKAISEWVASKGDVMCNMMARLVAEATDDMGPGAHDLARDLLYRLGALAAEGHRGLAPAYELLYEAFAGEVERDDRSGGTSRSYGQARTEFSRFHDGAIKKLMLQDERAMFEGYPEECHCAEVGSDGSPKRMVDLGSYDLNAEIPRTYAALAPGSDGYGTYIMGGELVELLPGRLAPISVDYLRPLVCAKVAWTKSLNMEGAKIPVPATPPKEFLLSVLADERRHESLPELRGMVQTPFWANVAGKPVLVSQNGYHPDVKIFLDMDPRMVESVEKMDLAPSERWVAKARSIIDEMLSGFPFMEPSDKATAVATFILPFVRELIRGSTPIHLFEAPTAGTGKGLLADCVAMVACGDGPGRQMVAVGKEAGRNEEMRKAITAAMVQMPTALILDNIDSTLDSPWLASMLTHGEDYVDRKLGVTDQIRVPNRAVWIATANNMTASGDIVRRIVPCRIDSGEARPQLRRFDVDLREWIPANRPALVWAILTLVAAWVSDGRPPGKCKPMGSYESYTAVMGGILEVAGYPGFLTNRVRFEAAARDDGEDYGPLIEEWAEVIGVGFSTALRAGEILSQLPIAGEYVDMNATARPKRLGDLLRPIRGRPMGKYILRGEKRQKGFLYWLDKIGGKGTSPRRRRSVVKARTISGGR